MAKAAIGSAAERKIERAFPVGLLAAAAFVLSGYLAASGLVYSAPAIRIADRDGRELALVPLDAGRFVHHYLHSVHLRPVDEFFSIEGRRLVLYELRYDTNSVGMPDDAELGFALTDGRYVLSMRREFETLPIMVSIVADHGIVSGGEFLRFADLAPERSMVVLSAAKIHILSPRRFFR